MAKTGLKKWFGEKWVDLSRPIYDKSGKLTGFEPCGRKKATAQQDTKDYPKCRPLKAAMAMSEAERKRAVRRKRKAEAEAPFKKGRARAPVMVRTNPWGSHVQPRFDASDLLEMGEPTYEYFDPEEIPEHDEDMLYRGRNVTWVGHPGVMMRIEADMVLPIRENIFYPDHIATLVDYIDNHPDPILRAPPARVHFVKEVDVEETQELEEQGYLYENYMSRPWEEEDIGKPYAVLTDGNHRAFSALLAGEPYIWVYVLPNYREDVRESLV